MNSINITRVGYSTPPSVAKKKALVLLQNAPSSRKGQSTLDTSPEKIIITQEMPIYKDIKGEEDQTKFSQTLFNKLLNDCEETSNIAPIESNKQMPMQKNEAEKSIHDLMSMYNQREDNILLAFVSH